MRTHRSSERGFALMLVFALAAAVAIMIYLEMPRLAFEGQREKEELLVMRGQEHIRAIQLFMRKNTKWPQNLDELEKYNNLRYLRRRYKDPMTGNDEWRLIHVDGMGQLTDSLVKKKDEKDTASGPSILASNIQGIGSSAEVITPGGTAQSSAALQRRASDRIIPGTAGGQGETPEGQQPPAGEGESRSGGGDPSATPPPIPGMPGGIPGQPGSFPGMTRPGTFPAQGANPQQGGAAGTPFQPPGQTGTGAIPGQAQPISAQPGSGQSSSSGGFGSGSTFGGGTSFGGTAFGGSGATASPVPAQPGRFPQGQGGFAQSPGQVPGMQQPGQPGQPNPALQMIQQIISNPRQGQGAAGRPSGGVGGQQLGGGIAGVASKKDAQGIKIYNERTNYKEWEFLYDPTQDAMAQAGKQGVAGQNSSNPNQQGQQGQQPRPGTGSGGSTFPRQ